MPVPVELRRHIRETIHRYCSDVSLRDAVLEALALPGFALHPEARCRAGQLGFESYLALRGSADEAAWGSASAAELYMEAGFLFDDVADHEVDARNGFNAPEVLALAIAMMNCGAASACAAAAYAKADVARSLQILSQNTVSAAAGQFMDARLESKEHVTTDDAITMTSLKAGGCGRLAASLGAGISRRRSRDGRTLR